MTRRALGKIASRGVQGEDGRYVLTYTQWSRKRKAYSVGIATLTELMHCTKHLLVMAAAPMR